MYFLSLDTAAKTATACVSVLDNAMVLKPLARAAVNATLTHSESLLPMIDFCLEKCRSFLCGYFRVSCQCRSRLLYRCADRCRHGKRTCFFPSESMLYRRFDVRSFGVQRRFSSVRTHSFTRDGCTQKSVLSRVFQVLQKRRQTLDGDALLTYEEIVNSAKSQFPGKKITLIGDGAEAFYALFCKQAPDIDFTLGGQEMLYEDAFSVARCAAGLYPQAAAHPESFTAAVFNPVYLRASQAERERAAKDNA